MHTKRRRILIIDDEHQSLDLLNDILSEEFDTLTAENGEKGIQIAQSERPDVVLLDLLMPKLDGARTCEALRGNDSTRHIPIIILTGALEMDPRIRAFVSGADDLVHKPYEPKELVARIRSKIRRIEERESPVEVLQCGNLKLDLQKIEASVEGRTISISVLEFNLLRYFVENKNRVVSRQKILNAVWKDSVVSDRTVDTHMASLRKKLAGFDHTFTTIYAAGYILKEGGKDDPTSD